MADDAPRGGGGEGDDGVTTDALERALETLPLTNAGPGGAAAVLREGQVLARHAWGWADVDRRIPFTPATLFRICSITKQFTCGLVLDSFADPSVLDDDVRAMMPLLAGEAPRAVDLANNQSGLRDYWATAMLCGSPIEAPFGDEDARRLIGLTRSLHFAPGTRYSYCNQNFRILGDIVAGRAGRGLGELLRSRIFDRAGMPSALLAAETSALPDGTVGYEGTLEGGFRPAVNRILWTGDAGIGASLDDMIAWERFIDTTRDDAEGLYRRLSVPQLFRDGTKAKYGFGLAQDEVLGHKGTSHGGGLRGWRSFRFNLPGPRISVVVMFNHMADPRAAALDLLRTIVDSPPKPARPEAPSLPWGGVFIEPETGLVVRVDTVPEGKVRVHFTQTPETLEPAGEDEAKGGATQLARSEDGVRFTREGDNLSSVLTPAEGTPAPDVAGTYRCAEYDATLTCIASGGGTYGAFAGFLGQGVMHVMAPVGRDLWRMPMPRALDHSPPGDWTIRVQRDGSGQAAGLEVGCWLARRIPFVRV